MNLMKIFPAFTINSTLIMMARFFLFWGENSWPANGPPHKGDLIA